MREYEDADRQITSFEAWRRSLLKATKSAFMKKERQPQEFTTVFEVYGIISGCSTSACERAFAAIGFIISEDRLAISEDRERGESTVYTMADDILEDEVID